MFSLGSATVGTSIGGASVLLAKQPDAQEIINKFTGATQAATTGQAIPNIRPNLIRVRVLNGSGISGQASKVATGLTAAGFNVADTGDAHSFTYNENEIRYGAGQRDKALVLQSYVQGGAKVVQDTTIQGVDLILTSGTSFTGVRAPGTPASSTTSTLPGPATTKPASKGAAVQLNC